MSEPEKPKRPWFIRNEAARDVAAVRAVHEAAFPQGQEAQLVDLLRERGKAVVSLVAESEGMVVGHVLFSPVELNAQTTAIRGLGLAPLAVLAAFRRQGLGGQLVRAGLAASKALGHDFVVVLGDPAYYTRFGFQRASLLGLKNDYGYDEPFRVVMFQPDLFQQGGGLVKYAPEFADLNV